MSNGQLKPNKGECKIMNCTINRNLLLLYYILLFISIKAQQSSKRAIAGMSYAIIVFILGRPDNDDSKLVDVCRLNPLLSQQLSEQYNIHFLFKLKETASIIGSARLVEPVFWSKVSPLLKNM